MREKDLESYAEGYLRSSGWMVYHTYDSRRSEPGFPDIVAIKGDRLLVLELKSAGGKVSEAQAEWLKAFAAVRRVDVFVVRGHGQTLPDLSTLGAKPDAAKGTTPRPAAESVAGDEGDRTDRL